MARSQGAAAVRVWLAETWPLAQATAAATVAWVIAVGIGGHADPFFAPIAAVVALNFAQGERGRSAVRLVLGTCVGIVVGELRSCCWEAAGAAWRWPRSSRWSSRRRWGPIA